MSIVGPRDLDLRPFDLQMAWPFRLHISWGRCSIKFECCQLRLLEFL